MSKDAKAQTQNRDSERDLSTARTLSQNEEPFPFFLQELLSKFSSAVSLLFLIQKRSLLWVLTFLKYLLLLGQSHVSV